MGNALITEDPPAGFEKIETGFIEEGDMVWFDTDCEWHIADNTMIADNVVGYYGVVRRKQ